jgi:hypothetical protein
MPSDYHERRSSPAGLGAGNATGSDGDPEAILAVERGHQAILCSIIRDASKVRVQQNINCSSRNISRKQ